MSENNSKIAYFSMEIGLRADLPTYSGGLGVLAGDTLKSAADVGTNLVAMTLLYHKGYFRQSIGDKGKQVESDVVWEPKKLLKPVSNSDVSVEFEGRSIKVSAWVYEIKGHGGHIVPVYFLDTKHSQNDSYDQTLCDHLYGGDERYRIAQEIVLGIGGVRVLQKILGKDAIGTYHMNEGHSSFLTWELFKQQSNGLNSDSEPAPAAVSAVKSKCVFTTHTPVAAGHDRFSNDLVVRSMGPEAAAILAKLDAYESPKTLNMTHLALNLSRYVNGVAKRHGEVSRLMFPKAKISAITNGIHAMTWVSDSMGKLFDQTIPDWRDDNYQLRYAVEIPLERLASAHREAKAKLIDEVKRQSGASWNEKIFTIGFARRAATYKRADLLFQNIDRLKELIKPYGQLQICFAGKAHPRDMGGKALIERVVAGGEKLVGSGISVVYLPNYDMDLGRLICAGVDLWLNNPVKPMEASGTSGMKAALNGVPSLSTLDGWWVEGCFEGVTGWEIEDAEDALTVKSEQGTLNAQAAEAMYKKLESKILPLYYKTPEKYLEIMRHCVSINAPFFTTQRMVQQYQRLAYDS